MHFIAVSFQRVMSTLYVASYNSVTFEIGPRIRKHFASLIFLVIEDILNVVPPNIKKIFLPRIMPMKTFPKLQ